MTGQFNTGIGAAALQANTTGFQNVAVGAYALYSNTTGLANAAVGTSAAGSNTTGKFNTALGANALYSNDTGNSNTAVGTQAMFQNTTGVESVAVGHKALFSNTTGLRNTAAGQSALFSNTTAADNTAVGANALVNATTGGSNIAIGSSAGNSVTTGSNNIYLGHTGIAPESQTTRLGNNAQNRTFITGIRGITTGINDAISVVIDSAGQLGTLSSSREVKSDIADIGTASEVLMRLHPVSFRYKAHEGAGPVQYGLIAEEVAEVAPGLVATGNNGEIETVLYQHLPPMLLNEYQKQQRIIEAQARRIGVFENERAALAAEVAGLREDRAAQAAEIAELRRAVEVLLARTSPEGRMASK
jgi:hypothetical protein